MSDVLEAPKLTVGMERKVNLGDYESISGSIYIQVPIGFDASSDEKVAAAKLAFADAHATLCEQLGIAFDVVEGVVVEKLNRVLGAQQVSAASEQQAVADAGTGPRRATVKSSGPVPTAKADKVADIIANPKGWFDNRTSKKGKQPDFKRKGANAPGEDYPPSLWVNDFDSKDDVPDPSAF